MTGKPHKSELDLRRDKLRKKCAKLRGKIEQENRTLFGLLQSSKEPYRIAAQCQAIAELGILLETTSNRLEELNRVQEFLIREYAA